MDYLTAGSLPWLAEAQRRLREAGNAGRLPHSSLILSAPGLGALHLTNWLTALALCEARAERPCGACASCGLLRADTHPDVHRVALAEDARQIKVDQIRDLTDALATKSYRGGCKIGIVEDAEALNSNGANAFLKTLEEPSADTLLIMIARPSHRLPATIASRCLRIVLRPPERAEALAWLQRQGPPGVEWEGPLTLAGGAPLLAVALSAEGIAELDTAMREDLKALAAGAVDVTLVAERWARTSPELRLIWLENWITWRVHTCCGGHNSSQSAEPVRLPAALLKPKIRALFELLDAARELRRLASTGVNQQLALEALLAGGRDALAA